MVTLSMPAMQDAARLVLIGVMATAVMDLWLLLLQRLGIPFPDYSLVGRWIGHMAKGRLAHRAISGAGPIQRERRIGWLTHYAVGIAYAGLLVALQGGDWMRQPSFLPALALGLATVVVPLFVMQPAMGHGFAAARTPAPLKTCLRSLANHAAFGSGLYVAAAGLVWLTR